jgi:alpha-glucosidase
VWDLPEEVLDDPVWENSGHTQRGRDGCRVPIPWEATGPSYGFGSVGAWLPQPPRYGELSAAAQAGVEGSTLELYRRAIAVRREWMSRDEQLEWVKLGRNVLAFTRGSGVMCVVNFGKQPIELPAGTLLVASVDGVDGTLPSDATAWIQP